MISPTSFEVYSFFRHGISFLYAKMYSVIYFIPEQSGIVSYLFRIYISFHRVGNKWNVTSVNCLWGGTESLEKVYLIGSLGLSYYIYISPFHTFLFLNFCVSVRFCLKRVSLLKELKTANIHHYNVNAVFSIKILHFFKVKTQKRKYKIISHLRTYYDNSSKFPL